MYAPSRISVMTGITAYVDGRAGNISPITESGDFPIVFSNSAVFVNR
jgi:hypothetical protein